MFRSLSLPPHGFNEDCMFVNKIGCHRCIFTYLGWMGKLTLKNGSQGVRRMSLLYDTLVSD